ncbi:hypothetical protein CAEBREN_07361 [Caenorhabditis brenneri]|uniref:C-type LECtin n=1 Tax=Caenorhabditis brenneri TaxID=135651 RepID=G0MDW1_CAEBE|nr:hypothetical protein CAEBREN_07361 [Caenorhabditis brenneri]
MRALLLFTFLIPISFSLKCVKIFLTPEVHFHAENNCRAISGTLVTIKNAIDNRAILNLASSAGISTMSLGLYCFGNNTSGCFWDDGSGSPISYNNFQTSNQFDKTGRGVVMSVSNTFGTNQGKWLSVNCYDGVNTFSSYPYMCETPPTQPMSGCKHNYNGYCYTTSKQIGNQKYDGNFAKTFNWIDGTTWDFHYMNPLNFQKGKCLVMDLENYGLWSQVDCDQKMEFLCKRKILADTAPTKKSYEAPGILLDASNCNSTLYLVPGSISSYGYPDFTTPPTYCSWRLVALGPYRMGIYFDFWATYSALTIYDEYGTDIGQFVGTYNRTPFARYTPFNMATITFRPKSGPNVDRGFHAVVLPL